MEFGGNSALESSEVGFLEHLLDQRNRILNALFAVFGGCIPRIFSANPLRPDGSIHPQLGKIHQIRSQCHHQGCFIPCRMVDLACPPSANFLRDAEELQSKTKLAVLEIVHPGATGWSVSVRKYPSEPGSRQLGQ